MKKELEQEIILIQGDLDEAEATVNELNNEIPRQQDILEQVREFLYFISFDLAIERHYWTIPALNFV